MHSIGVIVIGRNEGERLERCLFSVREALPRVVYVDSGSMDGSVRLAESLGVQVVLLDANVPFTAARARNAGANRLAELFPETRYVQFVDGDCEVRDGWIDAAVEYLDTHTDVVCVCGRRREKHPDLSRYNHLCDLEWDRRAGPTKTCGGDLCIRLAIFQRVGGYREAMIAGEEPEMCVRLRAQGGRIVRLASEMTLHDAAMTSFRQYWWRALRAGHAFAEGAVLQGWRPERHNVRQLSSCLVWGAVLPTLALAATVPSHGVSLAAWVAGYIALGIRITLRERHEGRSWRDALLLGYYLVLAKTPQALGAVLYAWRRWRRRSSAIIEYKGPESSTRTDLHAAPCARSGFGGPCRGKR